MVKTIEGSRAAPSTPSVDADEVAKFSAMAADWWNPTGKFKPLHRFNPVRLKFIRDTAEAHFGIPAGKLKPLADLRLLDIGCGGGLVCEPMARLGARVTGVDASEANIKTALTHAREQGLEIDYRAGTAEGLIDSGEAPFDIMMVASLNRTAKALATAVIGAEYILGWLPRGTHDWSKFVTPEEVRTALHAAGMQPEPATGVSYKPLSGSWALSNDTAVNFMVVSRRPAT